MDITFKTPEGRFNYRACAVIIHDEKLLVMKDRRSPYFYLPGGRVLLHETAESAVLREVREELGIAASIIRPLWMVQSFFTEDVTGEQFHELCLYCLVDVTNTELLSRGGVFRGQNREKASNLPGCPLSGWNGSICTRCLSKSAFVICQSS